MLITPSTQPNIFRFCVVNLNVLVALVLQFKLTDMSYYRESSYSRRSPPRIERELIEQELNLKNALRAESQNRRLLDELSLLQIKVRKTEELELKNDSLIKENSRLIQDNDHLARELSQRRYEVQRLKANTIQLQERDAIKTGQLSEVNHSLELEIELLKKQRLESNKLYESHIQKLQYMLEDKIKELDLMTIRCNDIINEKEVNQIKFEEELNKLKNLMTRTNHDMERELEYTKQKNSNEKFVEIETLKKNYTSQILLLEDQINKLKGANNYKHNEFENQLADNKSLRNRYEDQLRKVEDQNTSLRDKILKLQEINRSEVVNIEVKYKDLQRRDTTELITGHQNEIKTLINEINNLNWLLRDKNQEIQNLIRDKKEQKIQEEDRELAFRAEIDTLKNKLDQQQDKYTAENQELTRRINTLSNNLQRDSDTYHERVNQLTNNLHALESELNSKQNELDRTRAENNLQTKEQQRAYEELSFKLDKTKRELSDSEKDRASERKQFEEYKQSTNQQITQLTKQNRQLETERQQLQDKLAREADSSGDNQKVLRFQIDSLKKNVSILENNLSQEQSRHAKQMSELSANLKSKVDKLQAQQQRTLTELEESRNNQIQALNRRLEKSQRDREEANKKLGEYIDMYKQLDKHFKNPAEGSIFKERGESSLYETLATVKQSVINIF